MANPVYSNYNLDDIVMPVNVDPFEELLLKSKYDPTEVKVPVQGFRQGFKINYQGPRNRKGQSCNIPITIGSKAE